MINSIKHISKDKSQTTVQRKKDVLRKFRSVAIPSISVKDYLDRLSAYLHLDKHTIIYALIYLEKISQVAKLTAYNIHRILLLCITIALKYNFDSAPSNVKIAKVGGLSLKELNKLEIEILNIMNFELYIDYRAYLAYSNEIDSYKLDLF